MIAMNIDAPLMAAVAEDNIDEAKRLIQSGLDMNARCD
jgi:hypothetical protein